MQKLATDATDIMANAILETIKHYLGNNLFDAEGIIIGKNENGTYKVMINKQQYNVKNGTNIDFILGNKCLVHYINGKENKKIIIAQL